MMGLVPARSEGGLNGLHVPALITIGGLAAIPLKSAFTGLRVGETATFETLLLSQVPHRLGSEPEHQ